MRTTDPVYNETFAFHCTSLVNQDLMMEVIDEKSGDVLGEASKPLSDVSLDMQDMSLPVLRKDKKVGEVCPPARLEGGIGGRTVQRAQEGHGIQSDWWCSDGGWRPWVPAPQAWGVGAEFCFTTQHLPGRGGRGGVGVRTPPPSDPDFMVGKCEIYTKKY